MSSIGPLLGIDNVLFTVGDLDAAVDFYAGRLGLPLIFRLPEPGVALFGIGAETPGLLVRVDQPGHGSAPGGSVPAGPGSPRVWLEVRDARATAVGLADA